MRFISKWPCKPSQEDASSALTTVPLATRARMKTSAWPSVRNTAGTELPPRSRTIDDNLALAGLVFGQAAIHAVLVEIGGLHVAAEIAAIDLGDFAFAADDAAFHFLRHRLAQLVAARRKRPCRTGPDRGRGPAPTCPSPHCRRSRWPRDRPRSGSLCEANSVPEVMREILAAGAAAKARRADRAAAIVSVQAAACGQTGSPSVSGQRTLRNVASASASDMRNT